MAWFPLNGATTELREALVRRDISAVELTRECLDALHAADDKTHAVIDFNDERALGDARRVDDAWREASEVGPLFGLPITVKDWIDVEGFICTGGSVDNANRRPTEDATVVRRLRAAGAIVIAKTTVWGEGQPKGRVLHPMDPARCVGGSSSGEAAVVALGASPLGIGSDSGGSVRLPAAWNGLFGLKPTAGRVPTTGHFPVVGSHADGRTQIGPLTRSIEDLELVLRVIAGPDGADGGVAPVPLDLRRLDSLGTLRFATIVESQHHSPSAEIAALVEAACTRLASLGATRVELDFDWFDEAFTLTRHYWSRHSQTGEEVDDQLTSWDAFGSRYLRAIADVDVLVTPTTHGAAPLYRELTGEDFVFTLPASMTGSPALAVPFGADALGLPLSIQLIGRPWEDLFLIDVARALVTVSNLS